MREAGRRRCPLNWPVWPLMGLLARTWTSEEEFEQPSTSDTEPYMLPGRPQKWFLHPVHTRRRDTQIAAYRRPQSQRRCGSRGRHPERWEIEPGTPRMAPPLPLPSTETGRYRWHGWRSAPSHLCLWSSWCSRSLCSTPPYPWLWTLASFQCTAPQTSGPAAVPPPETPLVWEGLQARYSPWSESETASLVPSLTSSLSTSHAAL